jgi:hypothetical protein
LTQSSVADGTVHPEGCFPSATLIISTLRIFKEQLATQSRKPNASSTLRRANIWFGTLCLIDQANH